MTKVNPLLTKYWNKTKDKYRYLDLGSGDGTNINFMSDKFKNVVGMEKNYGNDILEEEFYHSDIISAFFVLHLLGKLGAYATIGKMQRATQDDGLNMICAFTSDVTWKKGFYFAPNELKELYSDWEILHYEEKLTPTYNGSNQMTAYLVAKKH